MELYGGTACGCGLQLLHQLSEPEQANIRGFLDDVERAWGFRFAPGYDPHLPFMCHLWEPLRCGPAALPGWAAYLLA